MTDMWIFYSIGRRRVLIKNEGCKAVTDWSSKCCKTILTHNYNCLQAHSPFTNFSVHLQVNMANSSLSYSRGGKIRFFH